MHASTAARTVQGGDSGEFGLLGMLGGVAHPPGYPVYAVFARLGGWLLPGPPFFRISLVSALCGAAATAVLQRALWIWSGSLLASVGAALAFGFSRIEWRLAGIPEVFTLNALAASLILLFALQGRTFLLGLTLGLGLANHQSLLWCAPLVVWPLLSGDLRAKNAGRIIAGTALGLLAYLLLPLEAALASPDALVWGDVRSLDGLLGHILRREYGTFALSTMGEGGVLRKEPLFAFFSALPAQYGYVLFVAGIVGLVLCLRENKPGTLPLLTSFALAGVVFIALLNAGSRRDIAITIEERFHLLPVLLCAPFVASGIAWAEKRIPAIAAQGVVAAVVLLMIAFNSAEADWRSDTFIEKYLVAAAQEAEPNAVVLECYDTEHSGARWVTKVLGVRPDVHFIDAIMLGHPWYREKVAREVPGFPLSEAAGDLNRTGLMQSLADSGHPAAILSWAKVSRSRLSTESSGFLDRVLPRGTLPSAPSLARAKLEPATRALGDQPPPLDAYGASLRAEVADKWMALADRFARSGQTSEAQVCQQKAAKLYPKGWGPRR